MQLYTVLVVTWEIYYSWSILRKTLCSTAETPVLAHKERSHLNSFWCCFIVFMRDRHWRSCLGIGLEDWLKSQVFECKAPLWCILTEKKTSRNCIFSSNFAHSAAAKPKPWVEYFGIKQCLSPLSQPFFTTTKPIVWKGASSYPYFAKRYHTTPIHWNQRKTRALGLTISKTSF